MENVAHIGGYMPYSNSVAIYLFNLILTQFEC